jgi:uncharacterized protein YjbI with pentapeptide repeats
MTDGSLIRERVSELVGSANSLAEYKTAAEALKALADYERITAENANQKHALRSEWIRTAATSIVPFLTLLTLAVTIYFQWSQATLTARANEDAQWRAVAESMSKAPGPTTDIVITTALMPFYDSPRYSDQAYEMVFLLVRRISDRNAFETVFRTAFGSAGWSNIHHVVRIGRVLNENFKDVDDLFNLLGGADNLEKLSAKPRSRLKTGRDVDIFRAAHARGEVLFAQQFLANQVGDLLRNNAPATAARYFDFSGFTFFESDLSNADLSGLDLSGADFQRVQVNGAILAPAKFNAINMVGTAWWDAKTISPEFLAHLLSKRAPDFEGEYHFLTGQDGPRVSREDYLEKVLVLCGEARISCDFERARLSTPTPNRNK